VGNFDAEEIPKRTQVLGLKLIVEVRLEAENAIRVITIDDNVINIYN